MATAEQTSLFRRLLTWGMRICCVLLAVWLLHHTVRSTEADLFAAAAGASLPFLAGAVLLYGFCQFLGGLRWYLLLKSQGMAIPLWSAVRLTLTGNFFSLLIPGAVTGDVIKIACVTSFHPGCLPRLAAVNIIDRLVGLTGIFAAAATAALCFWSSIRPFTEEHILKLALSAVAAGCLGALAAYLVFISFPRWGRWRPVRRTLLFCRRHLPLGVRRILVKVWGAAECCRSRQSVLLQTLLISVCIHLLIGVELFAIGRALHESAMGAGQYLVATQLSNASGLLAVTPGGIGLRDSVFALLFRLFGASPGDTAGTIPLLNSLIIVFWGVIGALIHTFSPRLTKTRQQS